MSKVTVVKKGAVATPTFTELLQVCAALCKSDSSEKIQAVLEQVAKFDPSPTEAERLLKVTAEALGIRLKSVKTEYDAVRRNLNLAPHDFGLHVAKAVLKEFYDGGSQLKRMSDGKFYAFYKTHWKPTTAEKVRSNVQQIAGNFVTAADKSLASLTSEAMSVLSDMLGADDDILGFNEYLPSVINCENGELWVLEDGKVELRPHRPESRLLNCLPFKYDPTATSPKFDKAILEIFGNASKPEEMVRHFLEFVGYVIQPRRHIPTYWILEGQGRNGKTKLMQTVQNLIGKEATLNQSIASFQKDKFSTGFLNGKLLFLDDDVSDGTVLNDGLLKAISEEKQLNARNPYGKQMFGFRCRALPVMIANNLPSTSDVSVGMIRRAKIIPFDRQFTSAEDKPGLFNEIWETEMSGILNRAVSGYQSLLKRGGFQEPEDCKKAQREFLSQANPLYAFLGEGCVKAENASTPFPAFREALKNWSEEQGMKNFKVPYKVLKRKLEGLKTEFGIEIGMLNGYHTVKGIQPKQPILMI